MKRQLSFLIIVLMLGLPSLALGRWLRTANARDLRKDPRKLESIFIDRGSPVIVNDHTIRLRVKYLYVGVQKKLFEIDLMELDCAQKVYRRISSRSYDQGGYPIPAESTDQPTDWKSYQKKLAEDYFARQICAYLPDMDEDRKAIDPEPSKNLMSSPAIDRENQENQENQEIESQSKPLLNLPENRSSLKLNPN
ncbi:MAG: hypothetical protein SFT81_06470 [Candidatus Caenarcaniphilales bacterium]|nr:hypothetical protein [Candidatus Caenarcaniphilales bacterium]